MRLGTSDGIESYLEVATHPPCHLSHLEIEIVQWKLSAEFKTATWNAFVRILTGCRETLKSLKMRDLGAQLKGLAVFPKLSSLHIVGRADRWSQQYRLFPADVSSSFPVLNSVTIELQYYYVCGNPPGSSLATVAPLKFFLWDEPVLSVTSLDIRFRLERHALQFVGKIFPNVTQLSIDWETCFREHGQRKYRREDFWGVWTVPLSLHTRI